MENNVESDKDVQNGKIVNIKINQNEKAISKNPMLNNLINCLNQIEKKLDKHLKDK